MEEIYGLPKVLVDYDKDIDEFDSVKISKPLGVIVAIDNEKDFKDIFEKDGDVEVFKQILSQEVSKEYWKKNKFPRVKLVSYKEDGDILFCLKDIAYGKIYGGYVFVCHYEFNSTAS